jgi:hypothetical protein
MEYLSTKWTTSLKKAGAFDKHNDWYNYLKDWDSIKGKCKLIPKWESWDKYYYSCHNFLSYCEKTDMSIYQVKNMKNKWFIVFEKLLKSYDWNDKAIKDLYEEGGTSVCLKQKYENSKEVLEHFISEVFYCSDRMNIGRLQRCQGIFEYFISMYKQENIPQYEYRGIKFEGHDCLETIEKNVGVQRLICVDCAKKYTGNDLKTTDNYWSYQRCVCEKKNASFHLYFKSPKEIKTIKI